MGDVPTPRDTDPVAVAGSGVWALVGMLLTLVVLRGLGVTSLLPQLLAAGVVVLFAIGFVCLVGRHERSARSLQPEHPLDECAQALREMQTRVLPGPVHDHLGYLRQAVDTERNRTPTPGVEQRGRELVAATERLVLAHHDLVGSGLIEPLARTAALEATLRAIDDTAHD